MSATFVFQEDNGAATGSPSKGTTRANATQVNWKSVDDIATAPTSAPIIYGTNSFTKYQFGKFTGTFNQIGSAKWSHTSGTLGTGLMLKGAVTSTYATPSQTANAALTTDMTGITAIGSGATVSFSTTGPEGASPTSTLTAAGYTQYLATQLQTTTSAAPGNTATVTLTLQYQEN